MNALAFVGVPLYALMAILELVFTLAVPLNGSIPQEGHRLWKRHSCRDCSWKCICCGGCSLTCFPRPQKLVLGYSCGVTSFVDSRYTYVCHDDLTRARIAPSTSLMQVQKSQQMHGEPAFYTPSHIVCDPYETTKDCEHYPLFHFVPSSWYIGAQRSQRTML